MQHLLQHIQQRLKTRKLYPQVVAQVVLNVLRKKALVPEAMRVQVKATKCTVFLDPHEDKPGRFLQKQSLLDEINEKLLSEGWKTKLKELQIS